MVLTCPPTNCARLDFVSRLPSPPPPWGRGPRRWGREHTRL